MKNRFLVSFKQMVNFRWMSSFVIYSKWLAICFCVLPSSLVFAREVINVSGDHTWHYSYLYYSNFEQAKAACDAYQASWDDVPCNDEEHFGTNPAKAVTSNSYIVTTFDPWKQNHYEKYFFYTDHYCPTPLVFSVEHGCIRKDDSCPITAGTNPISIGIGNKYQTETDFVGSGAFPLMVRRAYNSIGMAPLNPNQVITSWQFFSRLSPDSDALGALLTRRNGRQFHFSADGSGGWTSDADVLGTLEHFDDGSGAIISWRYTTLDLTVEDYDINGRLLQVTDRGGLTHTYTYNQDNITVTHNNGDVLTYQLTNRVSGFTTPDDKTYTYNYASGNLAGLTYPDNGGTSTYHYENSAFPSALTGITDANGDRFATWAYDADGRAISSEHNGGAEKVTIDYTNIDDETDPRAVATNALGKQTTYHFANIFGARKVTQVEGHPSTNCAAANKNYSYDANGFLASKTDWKGNTTTYVRNTKGQELSRTEASGTAEARTITTEWHPTFNLRTKVTELDRETLYSYDANGNLLSQQTNDLTTP